MQTPSRSRFAPLLIVRGTIVGLNFFSTLAVAAILSPSEFGQFVYVWALAQVLAAVASVGGQAYLLREASARLSNPDRGVSRSEALCIAVLYPTAIIGAFGVSARILPDITSPLTGSSFTLANDPLVIGAISWIIVILGNLAVPYRVRGSTTTSMLLKDASPHLIIMGALLAAWIFNGQTAFFIAYAFVVFGIAVVALAATVIVCSAQPNSPMWRSSAATRAPDLWKFWVSAILGAATVQLDVIIGSQFLSSSQLGHYQILRRVANLISLPQVVSNWTASVGLGSAHAGADLKRLRSLARAGAARAFVAGAALALALMVAFPVVLYAYAIPFSGTILATFAILILAGLINVAFGVNFMFASQCGMEMSAIAARLLGVLVLPLALVIPVLNGTGALLAFVFALSVLVSNMALSVSIWRATAVDTTILSAWRHR